jgi:pimeloyl-ACP methyl ester carboxylesterase
MLHIKNIAIAVHQHFLGSRQLAILHYYRQKSPMRLLLVLITLLFFALSANSAELTPFKDDLFAYPGIIEKTDGGRRVVVDYNELRDVNGRDEVPERRVKRAYTSPVPKAEVEDVALETAIGRLTLVATGKQRGAKVIVAYLHGKGGNRQQGSNDFTFGGNFNRIRNLMVKNGGLYLTPDFSDFGDRGADEVKTVLELAMSLSPGAKVFVACGSMGGFICHRLAADSGFAPKLAGMLLLGSFPDPDFQKSSFFKKRLPLFIGHGSADKSSPAADMEAFYAGIRASSPDYPVFLHRFETGAHGTPVRMADWRLALNLMMGSK